MPLRPQPLMFQMSDVVLFLGMGKRSRYLPSAKFSLLASNPINSEKGSLLFLVPRTWIGAPSFPSAQSNGVRLACGLLRGREDAYHVSV